MEDAAQIGIENVQRIHLNKFEKDFSFIVNGKVYPTNSFVANILSPHISKMFEKNMNISYYEINPTKKGDFNRIIKYGEIRRINIEQEEERQYFLNIMKLLGNNNEFHRFSKELQEDISYENVIQRIKTKQGLNINLDEEITFLSNNFHDFNTKYPDMILELDVDTIERIISNNQLKLHEEEELFDIILKLYLKSKEYSVLFSYVIFMNLSTQSIIKFNKIFDINDINKSIWENICNRFEQDPSNKSKEAYQKTHQEFLNRRYNIKINVSRIDTLHPQVNDKKQADLSSNQQPVKANKQQLTKDAVFHNTHDINPFLYYQRMIRELSKQPIKHKSKDNDDGGQDPPSDIPFFPL